MKLLSWKSSAWKLFTLALMPWTLLFPVAAMADDSLPAGVRNVLNHRKLADANLSLYVENLRTGETVLSWNEDKPRNPASVSKLLTTLVALEKLGPSYTWKTDIFYAGELKDDVLEGDLLLKGYGDPFLTTERLWTMLHAVRDTGVSRINGNLLLDDSYFDIGEYDPAAFDNSPLRAYNVAPNALLMNFKVVRYQFTPDAGGGKVNVRLHPELENLQVVNQLSIGDGRCGGYQRGITITPNESVDQMIFSGTFPRGCSSYAMTRTALGHNDFAYGLIKSVWNEMGGEISGGWKNVTAPEELEPILSFDSPSLAEIITMVNKYSNNVMAHQLLYTLAAEAFGAPGTEENGLLVVRQWLEEKGFDTGSLRFDNGAGLSRETRMSALHLKDLLQYAYRSRFMPEFISSMSLSGLDGTMSRRFREDDVLAGMAHIKTGSLDDVTAIAGFLQARSGERYIVVSLHNDKNVHRGTGQEVQEALLRWVFER
ncbi:MAG TPA: D-alanyl-D-alanine carboxypeptidase/D-alanyl-D-alanine-endopeptidase [Woeseiaceae bacterium]|nr:D-alanyl-D-alanine carboxypeptidase/D-alanyl-D-alanine-endopeptidase [Woeseiaceae bacterium]